MKENKKKGKRLIILRSIAVLMSIIMVLVSVNMPGFVLQSEAGEVHSEVKVAFYVKNIVGGLETTESEVNSKLQNDVNTSALVGTGIYSISNHLYYLSPKGDGAEMIYANSSNKINADREYYIGYEMKIKNPSENDIIKEMKCRHLTKASEIKKNNADFNVKASGKATAYSNEMLEKIYIDGWDGDSYSKDVPFMIYMPVDLGYLVTTYYSVSKLFEDNTLNTLFDGDTYDLNNDGVLNFSEINKITTLDLSSQNITSLKGIEVFTKLENLDCSNNKLTSIILPESSCLKKLNCTGNNITSLDITKTGIWTEDSVAIGYFGNQNDGGAITVSATCVQKSVYDASSNKDSETKNKNVTVNMTKHGLVEAFPKKDATSTEDGYKAYYKCACNFYFEDSELTSLIGGDTELSAWKTGAGKLHMHTFDKQIASEEYLKSEATCLAKAVYYKSCTCGEKSDTETFNGASTVSHKVDVYSIMATKHRGKCKWCGKDFGSVAHYDGDGDGDCDECGYVYPSSWELEIEDPEEDCLPSVTKVSGEEFEEGVALCWVDTGSGLSVAAFYGNKEFDKLKASFDEIHSSFWTINTINMEKLTSTSSLVLYVLFPNEDSAKYVKYKGKIYLTDFQPEFDCWGTYIEVGVASHTHNYDTELSADKYYHFYDCKCEENKDEELHDDANLDGKCDVCGHEMPGEEDCLALDIPYPESGVIARVTDSKGNDYTDVLIAYVEVDSKENPVSAIVNDKDKAFLLSMGTSIDSLPKIDRFESGKSYMIYVLLDGKSEYNFVYIRGHLFKLAYESTINKTGMNKKVSCSSSHTHKYITEKNDDNKHWLECDCGDVDKEEAHSFTEQKYDNDNHWMECKCGFKKDVTKHIFGTNYKIEEEKHWRVCECGAATEKEDHIYKDMSQASTCSKEGSTWQECSLCGHKKNEIKVPVIAHTPVIIAAVPATCTSEGLTEGSKCSVCNTVITAQTTVPKKEHNWDAGVITKTADYDNEGVKTFTCQTCNATKTEAIAKVARFQFVVNDGDKSYTVFLEARDTDGKCLMNADFTNAYKESKKKVTFAKSKAMKLEGYTLSRWEYNGKKISSLKKSALEDNMIVTAVFTENTYTINYKLTKPSKGVKVYGKISPDKKVKYSAVITLNDGSAAAASGYKLVGWTTEKKGTTVEYGLGGSAQSLSSKKNGKVTLYSVWEKIE